MKCYMAYTYRSQPINAICICWDSPEKKTSFATDAVSDFICMYETDHMYVLYTKFSTAILVLPSLPDREIHKYFSNISYLNERFSSSYSSPRIYQH